MQQKIHELYLREKSKLPIFSEPGRKEILDYQDVLKSHFIIAEYFNELGEDLHLFGVKNQNNLISAIERQRIEYAGNKKWTNIYEYAATLFYGLIKNHPFHDGNKRTALLTLLYHLHINKLMPDVKEKELDELAIRVAESGTGNGLNEYSNYKKFKGKSDAEVLFLATHLRKITRKMDYQTHSCTFAELNIALQKHGYWLEPTLGGNSIDIMKNKHSFFGTKKVSVGQVGFPGWKKQVSKNALQTIRQTTNLTSKDGHDWKSFMGETEPINSLISRYEGPLKRLRNK